MQMRWALPVAIAVYASLLGCAINIDHSLVKDSAVPDQPIAPDQIVDTTGTDAVVDGVRDQTGDQTQDQRPADGPRGDLLHCTPGAVQGCSGDGKSLVKCNASGWGTYNLSCASYKCSSALMRCDGCDPASPSTCSGSNRVSCSVNGLPQNVVCPLGCQGGTCCVDSDSDTYSGCAGDCNDNDSKVHPGQTTYYSASSNGSFDYNCNSQDEQEHTELVNCHMESGNNCVGAGWQGSVPACGAQGSFVDCKKQGNNCVAQSPSTLTQACR